MGGHSGPGHDEYSKVPDYRIYKVEDVPELLLTKRALASQGLNDPWLRNEVWRYNTQQFGTLKSRAYTVVFRGFKLGFGAFVLTIIGTGIYDRLYPSHDHHNHHHKHEVEE